MVRPLVFGYVLTRPQWSLSGWSGARAVLRFSDREGFAVAQMFVESALDQRRMALASLIEAVRYTEIVAVVVPGWEHLTSDGRREVDVKKTIEDRAGVPVISVCVGAPQSQSGSRSTHVAR